MSSHTHSVHIKPSGYTILVNAGETILAAALRQGYQFPHDCRNAVCGTCKGKLLDGQVTYGDKIIFALSEEERESGFALFCSAEPLTDCVIYMEGVIGPAEFPVRKLTCKVLRCQELSGQVFLVLLEQPSVEPLQYKAGQYIEILHRDMSPKPFSIANAPLGNNFIELHIRHTADNPFTTQVLADIQNEGELRIAGPYGTSIYNAEPLYPIIMLAGGTGFAPFKALIEEAMAKGFTRPMHLYWGVRQPDDFYMHELLQRWEKNVSHFHYTPVLSETDYHGDWQGKVGLVHEIVLADHEDLKHFQVYASGPPEMVYAAQKAFLAHGLNNAYFYSDIFDYVPKA